MRNFWKYAISGQIIFGKGAINELAASLKKLGVRKPFVITDKNIARLSITSNLKKALSEFEYVLWDKGIPEPTIEIVEKAGLDFSESKCDVVIGFGGGSSIDTAKATAVLESCGGKLGQYFDENKVPGLSIPIIAIPTTSGTGSEVTSVAVLEDQQKGAKCGISDNNIRPSVSIVDPLLVLGLPPKITAETGMDALCHAVEAYISVSSKYIPGDVIFGGSTILTETIAEKSIELIAKSLRIAVFQGQNEQARENMALGSLMAGMTFSNAGLGIAHAMSFPLASITHYSHGALIALILPYVMQYNVLSSIKKMKKIAVIFGEKIAGLSDIEAAKRGVQAVKKLQEDIGIATRLRDIGIKQEHFDDILEETLKNERLLRCNPRKVDKNGLLSILKNAY